MNSIISLFLLSLLFLTGCQKEKYTNAGKKILFIKGKKFFCKGKIVDKNNYKIVGDSVYNKNGKFIISLDKCRIKK